MDKRTGANTGTYVVRDGKVVKISNRVRGKLERAPYWQRTCNPDMDLAEAKKRGFDL